MANIPLKTIKFPGLANTYTIPEVSTDLTASGKAAEAAKVGAELATLGDQLDTNTEDIVKLKADLDSVSPVVIGVFPANSKTGSTVSFTDGANNVPFKDLTVSIEAVQSGSGDPSPDNIRPITGWTGANVTVNSDIVAVEWTDTAGTVYGGTLDVTTGVLVVTHVLYVLDGSSDEMWGHYTVAQGEMFRTKITGRKSGELTAISGTICDSYKVSAQGNRANGTVSGNSTLLDFIDNDYSTLATWKANLAEHPVSIVCELGTPLTYQLTAHDISTLYGENNVSADTGNVSVTYYADVKLYTNNEISTASEDLQRYVDGESSAIEADIGMTSELETENKSNLVGAVNELYGLFTTPTQEAVNEWLEEHPEATTTVQNRSLTEGKFSDALKLSTIKDYVTPEMYGAVGDGVTDDYQAIQNAINNVDGKCVYFGNKIYLISQSINLTKNPILNDGVIVYSGNSYALVLNPTTNIDGARYNLGRIVARNGGCLQLDSSNAWMQYITFNFIRLSANGTNCVQAKVVGEKWINEIRFIDGRFYGATNGVYIDHSEKTSEWYTSHWTFDRCGFEGVQNGYNIPGMVTRTSFTNCRAEESISNLVYSRATGYINAHKISWYGAIANGAYWKNCRYYMVTFTTGFISAKGVYVSTDPIVLLNDMLYGLSYDHGETGSLSSYGADLYDSETHIQTVDFSKVYDYTTENVYMYNRPLVRRWNCDNTGAITMNIYLDERMYLDDVFSPNNSHLLALTLSPSATLNIYDKEGGTLLYSETNGESVTNLKLIVTRAKKTYLIERKDISFITIS